MFHKNFLINKSIPLFSNISNIHLDKNPLTQTIHTFVVIDINSGRNVKTIIQTKAESITFTINIVSVNGFQLLD